MEIVLDHHLVISLIPILFLLFQRPLSRLWYRWTAPQPTRPSIIHHHYPQPRQTPLTKGQRPASSNRVFLATGNTNLNKARPKKVTNVNQTLPTRQEILECTNKIRLYASKVVSKKKTPPPNQLVPAEAASLLREAILLHNHLIEVYQQHQPQKEKTSENYHLSSTLISAPSATTSPCRHCPNFRNLPEGLRQSLAEAGVQVGPQHQ